MQKNTPQLLAIRIDHYTPRVYTECYHRECYQPAAGKTAGEAMLNDARAFNFGMENKAWLLIRHMKTSGNDAPLYVDMEHFAAQKCAECGKPILSYRYIVDYHILPLDKVQLGQVRVSEYDLMAKYLHHWHGEHFAWLEQVQFHNGLHIFTAQFWAYEKLSQQLVAYATNLNGIDHRVLVEEKTGV